MRPKILISEAIAGEPLQRLQAEFDLVCEPQAWRTPDRIPQLLAECRGWIVRNQTKVSAELLAGATQLEVVGRAGAGLDNVDVPGANQAGVVVVSTPDQNSISVAELAMGLMLSLARQIPAADRHVKAGLWDRPRFMGAELYGKIFGVVGLGRIGLLTAMRARAFGMKIVACDNYVSPDSVAVAETQATLLSLDELLATADFVSCHAPLTKETRGMFGYARFCAMKPSAYFLNLARGELVDEDGLARALTERRLAGAALDVRTTEPPPPGPLSVREDVILTPHIAAFTREAQARVTAAVCADVAAVLRGERPKNPVNFAQPRRHRS